MTWTLNASGHVQGSEEEATQSEEDLITKLRSVLKDHGASYASLGSQYHGSVNLLVEDERVSTSTEELDAESPE